MNVHYLTHVTALMVCVLIQWDLIHVPVVITISLGLTTSVMVGVYLYDLNPSIFVNQHAEFQLLSCIYKHHVRQC